VIVELRDLEDNKEGYISLELLDLNDLDIKEIEVKDRVDKEVQEV
jgi:hypothetical protein